MVIKRCIMCNQAPRRGLKPYCSALKCQIAYLQKYKPLKLTIDTTGVELDEPKS